MIIETKRLVLRPLEPADAPAITSLISDWDVIRWLTAPPWPFRQSDAEEFVASDMAADCLALTLNGQLIGVVGLHSDDATKGKSLGYWLGKPFHGAGYMTEAATAMIGQHFKAHDTGLHSGYLPGNQASANVLGKLGFVSDGSEKAVSRPLAREVTLHRVRLTAEDWRARNEG